MAECRFCHTHLRDVVIDLGATPLANSYISPERYGEMEPYYPLKVWICSQCGLVQVEEFSSPASIFSQYDYFSSYSDTWLEHARKYAENMRERYGISASSQVVEVASNDGYLLQYFQQAGIRVLGVEPAVNVAEVARRKGIPTETVFLGSETAQDLSREHAADLLIANNVLAHVPDINDFVEGLRILLKPDGLLTIEFPHVLNMIREIQFDTIYHEHFCYLSLSVVQKILAAHGLRVFHVEELPTHGGSLRVFACHNTSPRQEQASVAAILLKESEAHLGEAAGYRNFAATVSRIKLDLLEFLIQSRREGKMVCGYGAAAKGNTLFNYTGIRPDLVTAVADRSPHKQGKYLPGSRIPIISPERLLDMQPNFVLILPWNIREEVMRQLAPIRQWGGQFVTAVPALKVWP